MLGRFAEELVAEYLRSIGWEVLSGSAAVELAALMVSASSLGDVCRASKPRAFTFPARGMWTPSDWVVVPGCVWHGLAPPASPLESPMLEGCAKRCALSRIEESGAARLVKKLAELEGVEAYLGELRLVDLIALDESGRLVLIEVKAGSSRLSDIQSSRVGVARAIGAKYIVARVSTCEHLLELSNLV